MLRKGFVSHSSREFSIGITLLVSVETTVFSVISQPNNLILNMPLFVFSNFFQSSQIYCEEVNIVSCYKQGSILLETLCI